MRMILHADGRETPLDKPVTIGDIHTLLSAASLDTVMLPDGAHVMIVDDLGHPKNLPINLAATVLYQEKTGSSHVIRGDVVVTLDRDYC